MSNYLYLLIIFALNFIAVGGKWNLPLAAWIVPVFALRFYRNSQRPGLDFALLWLATAIPLIVSWSGATFFPRWIEEEPKKIIGFQNEKIDLMRQYRDAGPTYPTMLVDEFADITFVEDCGRDDESVIACAPEDLPAGYATRRNVG